MLLVSTDPASNLDEMLGVALSARPRPVPGVPSLAAMNIDPEAAAEAYRERVLAQMPADAGDAERATVREQLSGACTTEIAAFDEFAGLLAGDAPAASTTSSSTPRRPGTRCASEPAQGLERLPRGQRPRRLLPRAAFRPDDEGGPLQGGRGGAGRSGLTRIVLVSRPDRAALAEAARTCGELAALGLANQHLAVNGVFTPSLAGDAVARAVAAAGRGRLVRDAGGTRGAAARRRPAAAVRHGRAAGPARPARPAPPPAGATPTRAPPPDLPPWTP